MHFKRYKSILSPKNGMNIYRGCTHGCIYCDSRSKCYQMQHDFEDIEVKENAPLMLDGELSRRRKKSMVFTGSMCDPYLHLEKELEYTRKCLEVIEKHGFGAAVLTKSDLILRDIDLLCAINKKAKCVVQMTLTTFDERLCRILEPDVCTTRRRFEVLMKMRELGIPTVVWMTPLLPFINDTYENIEGLLAYCFEAEVKGIIFFDAGVTLREGDREYFYAALDRHFPGMKQQYIRHYGNSYNCPSPRSAELFSLLRQECEGCGILYTPDAVFSYMAEFPEGEECMQLSFF